MHFQKYGTIVDSVVMYKDGKHRGFGFVTFELPESALLALTEEQVIDGRTIDVKQAVPQGDTGFGVPSPRMHAPMANFGKGGGVHRSAPQGQIIGAMPQPMARAMPTNQMATDKVFVGGLPQTATEQMLVDYFGTYGTIVDCVVMKDRLTQRTRGFGFVQYDNTASVDQVMNDYENHRVDGKWVETKRAQPQDQMDAKGGGKGKGGFGKGKFAGGMPGGGMHNGGGYYAGVPQFNDTRSQFGGGNPYAAYGVYGGGKAIGKSKGAAVRFQPF